MDQLTQLFADRLDQFRRAMSKQVAAPTGKEVEIFVPFRVPNPRAFAPDQANGVSAIVRHDVAIELRDRLGGSRLREL